MENLDLCTNELIALRGFPLYNQDRNAFNRPDNKHEEEYAYMFQDVEKKLLSLKI